jgi:hypothetical protein
MFLTNTAQNFSFCTCFAAISEAFDYDMLFNNLSTLQVFRPAGKPLGPPSHLLPIRQTFSPAARFELSLEL